MFHLVQCPSCGQRTDGPERARQFKTGLKLLLFWPFVCFGSCLIPHEAAGGFGHVARAVLGYLAVFGTIIGLIMFIGSERTFGDE